MYFRYLKYLYLLLLSEISISTSVIWNIYIYPPLPKISISTFVIWNIYIYFRYLKYLHISTVFLVNKILPLDSSINSYICALIDKCLRNLYTNTVLGGFVRLFVRYRNYFPVVKFQNYTHIRNPHGPAEVVRPFGVLKAPNLFFNAAGGSPNGAPKVP